MPEAIRCTYYQFFARLTEWFDEDMLLRYQSEIFGQYAVGYDVPTVAAFIFEREGVQGIA